MEPQASPTWVVTAGLVALAAIDLVALGDLQRGDLVLAVAGALPVLVLGAFVLAPLPR